MDRHFNRLSDIVEKLQELASKSVIPQQAESEALPEQTNEKLRITLRLDNQRPSLKANNKVHDALPKLISTQQPPRVLGRPPSKKKAYGNSSRVSKKHIAAILDGITSEEDWEDVPSALSDENSTLTYYENESGEQFSWLKLTQAELAILRKQMKKNSTWQPSDTMMLKQLDTLGRGARGLRKWAVRTNQDMNEVNHLIKGLGLKGGKFDFVENEEDVAKMKEKKGNRKISKVDMEPEASPENLDGRGRRNTRTFIQVPNDSNISSSSTIQTERPRRESVTNKRKNSIQENKKNDIVLISGMYTICNPNSAILLLIDLGISKAEQKAKGRRASQPIVGKHSKSTSSTTMDVIDDDMPFDENEPLYCLCRKPQYGTMVQCDREDVSHPFSSFSILFGTIFVLMCLCLRIIVSGVVSS